MKNKNTLAVCIVFFNKATLTCQCLESIVASNIKIYVLNNGSNISSAKQVKDFCDQFENVEYLSSNSNLGCGGGRNYLIEHSTEDWLLFLDNDITMQTSGWCEKITAHLDSPADTDVLVLKILNVWDGTFIRPVRLDILKGKAEFSTVEKGNSNVFPGGGSLISRRLFGRVGLYNTQLWAFEDQELCLRAIYSGAPVVVKYADDILLHHHHEFVVKNEDKKAILARYDVDRIESAQLKIEEIYGIIFERDFKPWVEQQIRDHLVYPWIMKLQRLLKKYARNLLLKLKNIFKC
jgi:GT2 family glycosyltransferase